jgi:anti-sigma regulatory factor (Ser/Thr protein kinase)
MASGGGDGQRLEAQLDVFAGEIRAAGNETTARAINEAIEEGRRTAPGPIGFICECGSLGCGVVLELSLEEYEDVRGDSRRFLVAMGHQSAADELVAAIDDRYVVVAKRGEAATIAQQTDPRAEGPAVRLIWTRGKRISTISMELEATRESVGVIRRWLVGFGTEHGADEKLQGRIAIAVTEAMSNAVLHAYAPDERGTVEVSADVEDGDLEIVIADDGHGFRPGAASGLGAGLKLVAGTADRFAIKERLPHGIEVWMRFSLAAAES